MSRLALLLLLGCALAPGLHARSLKVAAPAPVPAPTGEQEQWAVVLDAGSTGSRVTVFKFVAPSMNAPIDQIDLDKFYYNSTEPGLSAYAGKPEEAAASLAPLVEAAIAEIPADQLANTHVMLGATAGLRLLPGSQAEEILAAARTYLKNETPFIVEDRDVLILSGQEEGTYSWAESNYLLGRLGLGVNETVAVIDMGGGSMQETFGMTDEEAALAPVNSTYLLQMDGGYSLPSYDLYTHSYLGFGSKAARAKILAEGSASSSEGSPCVPLGVDTTFTYQQTNYTVKPLPKGPSVASCSAAVFNAIKPYTPCGKDTQDECTFQGTWGGKRAPENVILMSSFWYTAKDGGLVPENATEVELTPRDFVDLAEKACKTELKDYPTEFPGVKEKFYPYFCLDTQYVATVLSQGFKFPEDQSLYLLDTVTFDKPSGTVDEAQEVELSWTLGAALTTLLGWETKPLGQLASGAPAPAPALL